MGMMPTPTEASLQTAMLPQIMQMKQAELMQKLAKESREAYLKRFEEYYGFNSESGKKQLQEFKDDFEKVQNIILNMIPGGEENKPLKEMYTSFLKTYPEMFLQLVPQEILQAKLSQKCSEQNRILREVIPQISESIVDIMRKLARLQEVLGVSPLVSTVMGEMPDPIALMTNPQYEPYKKAMKIFQMIKDGVTPEHFNRDPIKAMKEVSEQANGVYGEDGIKAFSKEDLDDAINLLEKTAIGSACAPYGPEFSQKGPKPNKNAAACLAEAKGVEGAWSIGNPSDPKGSKQMYRAQRLADGSIDWVLTGDMAPIVNGFPGMPMPKDFNALQYAQATQGMPGGFYQPQPKARKSKKTKSSSKAKKSKK